MTATIVLLDMIDTAFSTPHFPGAWQANLARACGRNPGDSLAHMYLPMWGSNTPMAIGVALAQLLQSHVLVTCRWGTVEGLSAVHRVCLAVAGTAGFLCLSVCVQRGLLCVGGTDYFYHVYNLLLPLWVLLVAPAIALHVFRWTGKQRRKRQGMHE